MKCELCHRQDAETVLYRTRPDGKREELYVCNACAERERAFDESRGIQVAAIDADGEAPRQGGSPMGELFGRLGKMLEGLADPEVGGGEPRCPGCGATMEAIRSVGLIGCPQCYKTFAKPLRALFDDCQGGHAYKGDPLPGEERAGAERDLERRLGEALRREDYREAKRLRAALDALRGAEGGPGDGV